MLPIEKIINTIKIKMSNTIDESTFDPDKFLDTRMIEYINQNLNDPSKRKGFLKAMERFKRMSENESDPLQAVYYYYRMLLPDKQSNILAHTFYQKEIRSRTGSLDFSYNSSEDGEEEEGSVLNSLDYGNQYGNKGMLDAVARQDYKKPDEVFSADELYTKLFKSKFLDEKDKLVLITYLILGTGPGMRSRGSSSNYEGVDLEAIMTTPPPELKIIEDQIEKLIEAGLDSSKITGEKILLGFKSEEEGVPDVKPLVDTKRTQIAQKNIQRAFKELTGEEDLDSIKRLLFGEAKDDTNEILSTISSYITGGKVELKSLIKCIVLAVQTNLKHKTKLSKSRLFTGTISDIVTRYIKLAKTETEVNIFKVQDLLLAPVLDDLSD